MLAVCPVAFGDVIRRHFACPNYIQSQRQTGWELIPERFDGLLKHYSCAARIFGFTGSPE
jgi:hypothetical protein